MTRIYFWFYADLNGRQIFFSTPLELGPNTLLGVEDVVLDEGAGPGYDIVLAAGALTGTIQGLPGLVIDSGP